MSYFLQDPQSRLTYSHDWTDWLASVSGSPAEVIASHQWTITPLNGTTPETPTLANETSELVTAEGMLAGKVYRLTEHIITNGGLEADRTITLRCDQR